MAAKRARRDVDASPLSCEDSWKTPDIVEQGLSDEATLLGPLADWLSSCHGRLRQWLEAVYAMHPACRLIPSEATLLALGTFREYAAQAGLSLQMALSQHFITDTALSVCLWTSIKFLTTPGAVPNARFLSKAIGLPHSVLVAMEPEVMRAVGWRLLAIARATGVSDLVVSIE
ncbi:hypothetical protein N2152v2_008001 [Parachlorella kessleri]